MHSGRPRAASKSGGWIRTPACTSLRFTLTLPSPGKAKRRTKRASSGDQPCPNARVRGIGPPKRIQAAGLQAPSTGHPRSWASGPGPRTCANPRAREPAAGGSGTAARRRFQDRPSWPVRPGSSASRSAGPHKRPHPRSGVHFLLERQRRAATHVHPSARGPGGARARPHAVPVPALRPRRAALGGPAPVSPQARLPLCAAGAPRLRHWPAGPGGQPLPGSPHAYA